MAGRRTKRTLIWIIVIVILIWIVWANGGFSWLGDKLSDVKKAPSILTTPCEAKALELIPSEFGMVEIGEWKFDNTNRWKDGTEIFGIGFHSAEYKKGVKEGENINYYYFRIVFHDLETDPLTYRKQVLDKDGTILGYNEFKIEPVLEPIPETLTKKFGDFTHQRFRVVDPNFISCKWVG